jgi:hypothetical protein
MLKYVVLISLCFAMACRASAEWKPADGPMFTRWAKEVAPYNVLPEYPRPQMTRGQWMSLNGLWDYAILPKDEARPESFDGQILVPFPVESSLSGVGKPVGEDNRLWYRRKFQAPELAGGRRLLLHFGAVDWHATVFVNGEEVGEHKGGYDPFTFDVTDALRQSGLQELVVSVWDPTDTWTQPRGKQVREPQGIWYTAVTGIWQTVWLEPVPAASIASLKPVPDIDAGVLRLTVQARGSAGGMKVTATAKDGDTIISTVTGTPGAELELAVKNAKLWSPDSPHLYDLDVSLAIDGTETDVVSSYFGMRKTSLVLDAAGHQRLALNNEPLFQVGPLDQGWWPDGLYTAPTDDALKHDVEILKECGFNMLRKHVKVEPARYYYHCDKLGILVWQDMPSGCLQRGQENTDTLRVGADDDEDADRPPDSAAQFETELKAMIDAFGFFPSIVMWVPFNEGWGQYDTQRIAQWIKQYDPSRLVNATSGWTDRGVGDVYDVHSYPGPAIEDPGPGRAVVLGEFGGLGWPVEDHLWWNKRNWGYQTFPDRDGLNKSYKKTVGNVYGLLGQGLAAAVYTQTTDVEGEINGLMTYDRDMLKFDAKELTDVHGRLYRTPPTVRYLVESSEITGRAWNYRFKGAGPEWKTIDPLGPGWQQGDGPFQTGTIKSVPTGTEWTTNEIMLRRTFELDDVPGNLWLNTYFNMTNLNIYINGTPVAEFEGLRATSRHYRHFDISENAGALKKGKNILAVYATKDKGLRAVDVALYTCDAPK